jgi:2-polyprenyl-3-methyl-5-hydroxy-6-metoxy-1,4-benzoquinol methylase
VERRVLHRNLRDRVFGCAPGEWELQQCSGCGSGYLDPRPTAATIALAYTTYCTHTPTGGVDYTTASRWRRFRIAQRNAYLNANYGYDLKPAAWSPLFLSTARRRRFDTFTGYLHFPGRNARVLDIGCGNGSFLWQMRSLGWEVCGVEPDPQSAERARAAGLEVHIGLLQQQSLPEAGFDAVTMFHVVEHLHDPMDTLRRCWKLLKPGGCITVVTPNMGACGHRYFGPDWMPLDPPRHLVLFTEKSLGGALETCGFMVSRPPRTPLKARELFKQSFVMRYGGAPMTRHPPLSWSTRLAMEWQAFRANRTTRKDPGCAEELVLLGRKPA